MAYYDMSEAIIDGVIDSSNFENRVKEIVQEEVESAIDSAIENEDIEDKVNSAFRDYSNRIEELEEAAERYKGAVVNLTARLENVENTLNGVMAENDMLKNECVLMIKSVAELRETKKARPLFRRWL